MARVAAVTKRKRNALKAAKCCAPFCQNDALCHVEESGDHGAFVGDFCDPHYRCWRACFPAQMSYVRLLVAVSTETIIRELDR